MKLGELADLTGGKILCDRDYEINGVAGIQEAGDGDITFLSNKKGLPDIAGSRASAIMTSEGLVNAVKNERGSVDILVVENPQ